MRVAMAVVALTLVGALPVSAHTQAEQAEWHREWVERVQGRGLTRALLAEYLDFRDRHVWISAAPTTPAPSFSGMGSGVEQWRPLVAAYFGEEVNLALCIMAAESGGNPNARNPRTGAAGLFQIMPFWWDEFGGDRYDPETNVRVASVIRGMQGWAAWSPYKRGLCR